jgi:hypothetical protein
MIGKTFMIRFVGTLTCVAAVAAGWDAEAACRRHHRRAACCYEVSCCEPAPCCAPVCETACPTSCCTTACAPAYERVLVTHRDPCTNCCHSHWEYRAVEVEMATVISAPRCCDGGVITAAASSAGEATAQAAGGGESVVKTASAAPTPATK